MPDDDGRTDPVVALRAEWPPGGDLPSPGPQTGAELAEHLPGDATDHPAAPADVVATRWPGADPKADPDETTDEALDEGAPPYWDDGRGDAGPAPADPDAPDAHMVIVWDHSDGGAPPLLGLRVSKTPGMTDILLDGAPVATLPAADVPPPDSIVLISESAAAGLPV
ncbi:hypothetical protein KO516_08910 [Citreicella sp. C3M06]|uniref:hypothetical protein n=1 Tax=Citreicella sp. C3M06 TaxID=2841564 RepID=UPI001C0A612B|nr:hypothetical protein [Citreicella sp. C3M06]MBU2960932.1 hypothetical protein [Citreicella sp. C3M06]